MNIFERYAQSHESIWWATTVVALTMATLTATVMEQPWWVISILLTFYALSIFALSAVTRRDNVKK